MDLKGSVAKSLTVSEVLGMSEERVVDTFDAIRWPESNGSPLCPRCGSGHYYTLTHHSRFRCIACDHQYTETSGTIFNARKLCLRSYLLAIAFFANTSTNALQFSQLTGLEYRTAWLLGKKVGKLLPMEDRLRPPVFNGPKRGRKHKVYYLKCEECRIWFIDAKGGRSSDLRRGKIKHTFCSHHCAMNFGSRKRKADTCKRCCKTRKELARFQAPGFEATGVSFTRGYCPKCWGLLYAYHQDEELVKTHELTQQLRKEARDDFKRKKHRRPAEDAAGSNRRGPQGQSRSPTGTGNQRTQLADFTICPTRL